MWGWLRRQEEKAKLMHPTEEVVIEQEPWFHRYSGGEYLEGDTLELFLSFKDNEEFSVFRDKLIKDSSGFYHLTINEKTCDYFKTFAEIVCLFALDKSLEEVAEAYPRSFENYINHKKREELLNCGKDDIVEHLKLLKKDNPELARQKVLEIIKEVL